MMGYQCWKYYRISYPILALIPKMWDKGKDNFTLFSVSCFVNGNAMIFSFFFLPLPTIRGIAIVSISREGYIYFF